MIRRPLIILQLLALLGGCNATGTHGFQGEPQGYWLDNAKTDKHVHYDGFGRADYTNEYADGKMITRAADGHIVKITPIRSMPAVSP